MAIVITNGKYYVCHSVDNGIRKTNEINEAMKYDNIGVAIRDMRKAPSKTKDYYVFDTLTNHVIWKWMSEEEKIQAQERRLLKDEIKRNSNGKIKRKHYSQTVRKMIYNNAGGRCELCGKQLLFFDMTLDHRVPLAKGGIDSVENLSCSCVACNTFKGQILPSDFMERITDIFMYQMEKKYADKLSWKIVHRLLARMI